MDFDVANILFTRGIGHLIRSNEHTMGVNGTKMCTPFSISPPHVHGRGAKDDIKFFRKDIVQRNAIQHMSQGMR